MISTIEWSRVLRRAGFLWLAVPGLLVAQTPAPATALRHAAAIDSARAIVAALVQREGIIGVSVAVGVGGELVWSQGFGFADAENRSPVTPETKFRIGSVSKSLTAAAVGLLVEQRQLDLDAPVQRYVPYFPRKQRPITTRQLGGHIAGIRHYRGDEFLSSRRYDTVRDGLAIFEGDTLLFEPGTRYAYSSYGWNLIAAVIEGAARQPFLTYMRTRVFEPLGMRNTVADHTDSIIPFRTRFYMRDRDGTPLNAPYVDNSHKWVGGGFLATPEDLVRFGAAHLTPTFLRPETVRILWTSQRLEDGEQTGYGIGWRVGTDAHERRVVSHSGGSVGGRSLLLIYPDQGVVIAMAANMTDLRYGDVPERIAELFMP